MKKGLNTNHLIYNDRCKYINISIFSKKIFLILFIVTKTIVLVLKIDKEQKSIYFFYLIFWFDII